LQVQGRFPQEVELDAADTAFLAAILDVIEAYGQVRFVIIPHCAWLTCSLQLIACCMLSMHPCINGGRCSHALQALAQYFKG